MISVAIQAHPERAEMADALAEQTGAEVVMDPGPHETRSPWRTYRLALETTPAEATHRLIVQDDTEICRNFIPAVGNAVAAQPDRALVFFVSADFHVFANAVWQAADASCCWTTLDNQAWCPVVATCWPRRLIQPLLNYVDGQSWPESFCADDEITGRFLHAHDEYALASVPSLVDHPDVVRSIGRTNRNSFRNAACWIGECDPLTIDWTLEPFVWGIRR